MNMEVEQQLVQEIKSSTAVTRESDRSSAGFDCSICLDYPRDPVVTLCGHLYCWPCIYKWLEFQDSSLSSGNCTQCPICKAEISGSSVIPLYGRGQSFSESDPDPDEMADSQQVIIPPRANNDQAALQYDYSYQNMRDVTYNGVVLEESSSHAAVCNPVVGMFGEMVYARVFRNSQSLYAYPNSYCSAGSNSPRLRRLEKQVHKSLNKVSFFLFCCLLLCMFLF